MGQIHQYPDRQPKLQKGVTPSFSIFVDVDDEADLERLFAALGDGGSVMMPRGDYGFSRQFAWVSDRYGVSWQLNLP